MPFSNKKMKSLTFRQKKMLEASKKRKDAQAFYDKIIKPRIKDRKVHPNIVVVNDGDNDEDDFF